MLRRWCMALALAALTVGTALTATSASAAPDRRGALLPRRAGSPDGRERRPHARPQLPGGEHELVRLRGNHRPYTSVSASWTQPAGICSRGDQYAAFWVGLDGYSSSTVEQTGSEVDCVGRTAQYYAWYEMYPDASVNYSNTVRAGDHFTATVTYLSGEQFSLYIADTTQGWSHTTDASLGRTPPCPRPRSSSRRRAARLAAASCR